MIKLQWKWKMKKISRRYDTNRPRPRYGHKYTKVWVVATGFEPTTVIS